MSNADVFQSPAVALLVRLENAGFQLAVTDTNQLRVWPVERVDAVLRAELQAHREALRMLVRICDDGVQQRRELFAAKLAERGRGVLPDLVVQPGIAPVKGRCVSCAEALDVNRMGKCWRCCLAWRLAAGVPVSPELELVLDETRRVA